jgi:hypothetical protein
LSGARNELKTDMKPGPAQYEINRSDNAVYASHSGAKFGSGTRDDFSKMETPGPGTYYYLPNNTGGVSMGWRYPQKEDWRSPGPAAYDQKYGTIQAVVDTQQPHPMSGSGGIDFYGKAGYPGPGSYNFDQKQSITGGKIGSGIRSEGKGSNYPGPGYYDPKNPDSTSIVFGSEKRDKAYNTDTPGPGYYYIPCTVADVPRYVMPVQEERYKWV